MSVWSPPVPTGGVSGVRYNYMTAAWNAPLSLGVQAKIQYNGYVINDRYQADRIRVTSITGLDGPDVTDVRESIPGDEGEFVYDSILRGRTFVMTGTIQAGSLASCEQMQRDLRAAYASGVEGPMKFSWFDVYDGFDDPNTLSNYTPFLGATTGLSVAGGALSWGTTSPLLLMRTSDNKMYSDVQATLRVVVGGAGGNVGGDASTVSLVLAMIDANNYLEASYHNTAAPTITVSVVSKGVSYPLSSTPVAPMLTGTSFWLRGRKEGDLVTAELWTTPPADTSVPASSTTAWLTGYDSDELGDHVLAQVGFGAQTATATWTLDDFSVQSICPGDVSFDVRSIQKPSISDTQQKRTTFERQFQLTLRASKPFGRNDAQQRSRLLRPTAGDTTDYGFGDPITDPLEASSLLAGSVSLQNNILSINNRGTAPTRPILYVFGAASDFVLYNLTNEMQLGWTGSLMDGSYLAFDCAARTLVDQNGADQQAYLTTSDPRWLILEPGWNDIYVAGSIYSTNTALLAFFWARWI